eukprot:SAG31_NODE_13_length_37961_cov_21.751307_40_plen_148_part_00
MQSPIKEELEVHGWIVQKQIQPGENAATTEFRKDPAALGVAQLITRARNLGASQPKLERAVNHVDRQTALVQLVKAREACRAAEGNPAWELKIWLSPFHKNTPADAVRVRIYTAAMRSAAHSVGKIVALKSLCLGCCAVCLQRCSYR